MAYIEVKMTYAKEAEAAKEQYQNDLAATYNTQRGADGGEEGATTRTVILLSTPAARG